MSADKVRVETLNLLGELRLELGGVCEDRHGQRDEVREELLDAVFWL